MVLHLAASFAPIFILCHFKECEVGTGSGANNVGGNWRQSVGAKSLCIYGVIETQLRYVCKMQLTDLDGSVLQFKHSPHLDL